jgi:hypothetical protein
MKISAFAVRSHIRNVVLCSLLTFGLAACGADDGSSSSGTASAASDPIPSLVAPSVGVIDRTGIPSVAGTTATAANATQGGGTTTQGVTNTTQGTTPVSSTTLMSSSTSVASNTNTSTNSSPPPKANNTSTGTATLDWMPPTQNTDGSVLTNLAGYTVYYGTSASNLTQSVKVTNPGLTAYTLSNLPSGTWYFAVTSYSSTGIESSRSGIVSTMI